MKVLVTARLPEVVIARISEKHEVSVLTHDRPATRQELLSHITDIEGLLCTVRDPIDDQLLEQAPNLRMIANFGVGYDNIDLSAATVRGIWVSNTPGVLTDATADLTFALILAAARRVAEGDRLVRVGKWRAWTPLGFLGSEVTGKTIGIIGLGSIGKAVAQRAKGFRMPVLYHNRTRISEQEEQDLGATYRDLDSLLAQADFVTLHVTLNPDSRHLIGPSQIARMKRTAFLINASRGPAVDEAALLAALKDGAIAGAGLDVYENEPALTPGLIELDNVVLLPHMGSATLETRTRMALLAAENLLAGLAGTVPPNCLNPITR